MDRFPAPERPESRGNQRPAARESAGPQGANRRFLSRFDGSTGGGNVLGWLGCKVLILGEIFI